MDRALNTLLEEIRAGHLLRHASLVSRETDTMQEGFQPRSISG
jgi:hypothetical protein